MDEDTVVVVMHKLAGVHLHLTLFQQQLHLQVECKAQLILLQSGGTHTHTHTHTFYVNTSLWGSNPTQVECQDQVCLFPCCMCNNLRDVSTQNTISKTWKV